MLECAALLCIEHMVTNQVWVRGWGEGMGQARVCELVTCLRAPAGWRLMPLQCLLPGAPGRGQVPV